MSTNIDHVETLVLDAWMHAQDVVALCEKIQLPSDNFLSDILEDAERALADPRNKAKRIKLKTFNWRSEWSGNSYDDMVAEIAPKVMGKVEAIFTWEGREFQTGLQIEDGKITECDVVQTLVPKKK